LQAAITGPVTEAADPLQYNCFLTSWWCGHIIHSHIGCVRNLWVGNFEIGTQPLPLFTDWPGKKLIG